VAQLSAARHSWEEASLTFHTFNTVQQELKKHIITVFEPMYLDILNDDMVGFSNITAREMIEHLFITYGIITAVDLEHNFEQMRKTWDPQQPVETLFKQIQDCAGFSEAGGVKIGNSQQMNVVYAKIFATGNFMSACRRWNEKETSDKIWANFKDHFAGAHLPERITSTSKCKGGQPPTQATMQQIKLLDKLNIKWLNPTLEN
jgi:hypothetical protein